MIDLFIKKKMNMFAAQKFWDWFLENESWIVNNIKINSMEIILKIDSLIKPIFPYFKKELEFQLGYNNDKGEIFFFHFGNKNLIKDANILASMMPDELSKKWVFILEE